jgi:esterase/lipase
MVLANKIHANATSTRRKAGCSYFLQRSDLNSKVCLFFHGFTATPRQFVPLGKTLYRAGYNILIPRLPGHCIKGHWDRHTPPPLPESAQTYKEFGLYWLEQAQQFGDKVIVGGLSGGSTLAAWLALERPHQIDRALLFAPYLSSSNKIVDWVVRSLNFYFKWKTNPEVAHFGYEGFSMPSLRVFLDMGQEVLKRTENEFAAPMLIVSSKRDTAVSRHDHYALFQAVLKHQPKTWYHCFNASLDIQHNMMTKDEGNSCVDLVMSIAKAYVDSDLAWDEVQQIRDRIAQGLSFQDAVNELHLEQRVSPDLITLLTT